MKPAPSRVQVVTKCSPAHAHQSKIVALVGCLLFLRLHILNRGQQLASRPRSCSGRTHEQHLAPPRHHNLSDMDADKAPNVQSDRSSHVATIDEDGDIVVAIKHASGDAIHNAQLRLRSSSLRTKSKYFDRVLQTDRFGEGAHVQERHTALREQYPTFRAVPADKLPILNIEELGRISSVRSIAPLLSDFFSILGGKDISTAIPVANLANLAIVGDRFDALDALRQYMRKKKLFKAIEGKTTPKQDAAFTEEKLRQRILIGLMLDHSPWVEKYSARLIMRGSALRDLSDTDALWWDLPGRVEDEVAFRRICILNTIQALQDYFLAAYSTRVRQCRLGYDSSAECDSFQFGEMVRFFLKIGTLRLQGSLLNPEDTPSEYDGDLLLLIERLKQIPEYQVDRNHSHCGIRTRIVPLLDLITTALQGVGICGDCWLENWTKHAWMEAKRPIVWKRERHGAVGAIADHEIRHDQARSLFLAVDRVWI